MLLIDCFKIVKYSSQIMTSGSDQKDTAHSHLLSPWPSADIYSWKIQNVDEMTKRNAWTNAPSTIQSNGVKAKADISSKCYNVPIW